MDARVLRLLDCKLYLVVECGSILLVSSLKLK